MHTLTPDNALRKGNGVLLPYDRTDRTKILNMLYANTHGCGYMKFMSTSDAVHRFYNPQSLCDPLRLQQILNARYGQNNLYLSIATYKTKENAREANIKAVCALAIDVDYRTSKEQDQHDYPTSIAVKQVAKAVLHAGVPTPTYIEASRNIRLVYVLDQPFQVPRGQKGINCRTFLKRITEEITKKLNAASADLAFDFCASPQKLTSYVRLPGSINSRVEGYVSGGTFHPTLEERYPVSIALNTEKLWDIHALADYILPPLFDGYEEWKARKEEDRKARAGKKIVPKPELIRSTADLARARIRDLETLQKRGYDIGYREQMCYFFWIFCRQSGLDAEKTSAAVFNFNRNFAHPLPDHRVMSECKPAPLPGNRPGWLRKFKDETIRANLGLGNADPDLFNRSRQDSEPSNPENPLKQVKDYIAQGLKLQEIADKTGLSLRTVKRISAKLRTDQETPEEIVKSLKEEGLKLQEIADKTGLSLRTVKQISSNLRNDQEDPEKIVTALKKEGLKLSEIAAKTGLCLRTVKQISSNLRSEQESPEEIIKMLINEGLKLAEIADRTGLSINVVKKYSAKIKKLQKEAQKNG